MIGLGQLDVLHGGFQIRPRFHRDILELFERQQLLAEIVRPVTSN